MNDEQRCTTCSNWLELDEGSRWGECLIAGTKDDEPQHKDTKAHVFIDIHFKGYAELLTRFDFGCVQWEGSS